MGLPWMCSKLRYASFSNTLVSLSMFLPNYLLIMKQETLHILLHFFCSYIYIYFLECTVSFSGFGALHLLVLMSKPCSPVSSRAERLPVLYIGANLVYVYGKKPCNTFKKNYFNGESIHFIGEIIVLANL